MDTTDVICITDPSQLLDLDLNARLCNLAIGASPSSQLQPQQVRLDLLQPLASPAMEAACQKPWPPVLKTPSDYLTEIIPENCLDISALSKAWRDALAKVPPMPRIIFNLNLPKPGSGEGDDGDALQKFYWEGCKRVRGQHKAIVPQEVVKMVTTIAAVMHMRAQGEVHFALMYSEYEGLEPWHLVSLCYRLQAFNESGENI